MPKQAKLPPTLEQLIEESWIDDVVSVVKSGKEATVYCCRADTTLGRDYVAVKVYKSRENRGFKNDSQYQEGRVILGGRLRRAVQKKTKFGREVQGALWRGYEYEYLQTLHAAGANVPEPLACAGEALIMEYIGDGSLPGKPLHSVDLDSSAAQDACRLIMNNIALWLRCDIIHGDLSPFNVLHTSKGVTVIDFPQAADPRFNPHARDMLQRDIENMADYFDSYGIEIDSARYAQHLWSQWKLARL